MAAAVPSVKSQYSVKEPDRHIVGSGENRPGHKKFSAYNLPRWVAHPLRPPVKPIGLIFPGEQNHSAGMLKKVLAEMPICQEMVAKASEVFGFDILELINEGDMAKMAQTGFNQPLIYVANCCALEKFKATHPDKYESCQSVSGFSIGEYTALVAAGVITYEIGLEIVKVRAEAMQAYSEKVEMEAIAVNGVDWVTVQKMCEKATKADTGTDEPFVMIARHWSPKGFICAGKKSSVIELHTIAQATKGVLETIPLENHIHAGHTELCREPAEEIARILYQYEGSMQPPRCELYLNHIGWRHVAGTHPSVFIGDLCRQITTPLLWSETVMNFCQEWVNEIWEIGPNRSLKFFMISGGFEYQHSDKMWRPFEYTNNMTV